MKNVGLFFGSFNPIHVGHLIIGNTILQETDLNEIWFVVSPQNPFKNKKSLLAEHLRLEMVDKAIEDNEAFRSSNIEFLLSKPSYTIDTLLHLEERHGPNYKFNLIMGSDNLVNFNKWKNHLEILKNYHIFAYNRPGSEKTVFHSHESITVIDGPLLHISASLVRKSIKESKSVKYLVTDPVLKYLNKERFYK